MERKRWILIISLICVILIPLGFYINQKEEVIKDMQHRRFVDLSITSAKKPFNTHLLWEHATYGLVMVDSTDQTVLIISTDKGDNWSTIDLSDNTNSYKIQAGWLDGNDLWLVMCDNDGTADDFEVFFIELDDSNDCNPIDVSAGADINTVFAYDIFKIGANFYVINKEDRAASENLVVWDVDTNPFVEKDAIDIGALGDSTNDIGYGIIIGDDYHFIWDLDKGGTDKVFIHNYDGIAGTIGTVPGPEAFPGSLTAYSITSRDLVGITFDGIDTINYVVNQDADGKNYLITHVLATSPSVGAEHDVSLMLDRNNIGTVPNELEKAFGISNEIVYEIKARRGGIVLLQNLSSQLAGNIVGLTDNFLIASDGGATWDMYEFQDVTDKVYRISYNDGIIGIRKKGGFMADPANQANWSEGDSIKIYDQYDQLEFWGIIREKNRNNRGLYVFRIESFTNEIYYAPYENTYSADDTDTKQKDIIDNALNFCYRSSSIIGTTTTYDYAYNRAVAYLFFLGRRLERQIPYIEPDGKIWTKAHDGLARNDMIYGATYNFKDDDDDTAPDGWTEADTGTTTSRVIASLDGHRKVVHFNDDDGAGRCYIFRSFTQSADQSIEFWLRTSDDTKKFYIYFYEGATRIINMLINVGKLQNVNGGFIDIADLSNDTWHHIRMDLDDTADTYDCYVDGVVKADLAYENASTISIDTIWLFSDVGDTGYDVYFDALGISIDSNYTVGDNLIVWELSNHWQIADLIDIPGIEEKVHGVFSGNTGITRNTIRYKNNAPTIRPISATRDPIEQLVGIKPLNEFRDPKLEDSTEADQLGDNRYAIWAKDTKFIGLRIEGQGYLQPGKTIEIQNLGEKAITLDDFVILSFLRDPKRDIYFSMVLSDNIIFPEEFANLDNTSRLQTHTASVQAIENQFDINLHLTREGGIAVKLTNKTGVASVKGTIIEAHAGTDNAFRVCDASSVESFGVVYEDGIADGSECLVVIGGRAQVLLKDATLSARGNWVGVSDVAGRADATGASPPAQPEHFKEVGHCIESKGADTDVLSYIIIHHN